VENPEMSGNSDPGDTVPKFNSDEIGRIQGIVIDQDSNPIPNTNVTLCLDISDAPGTSIQGEIVLTLLSDAEGRFDMQGVEADVPFMIRADHQSYASTTVQGVSVEGAATKQVEIRMIGGLEITGTVYGIEVVLTDPSGATLDNSQEEQFERRTKRLAGAEILVIDKQLITADPRHQVERTVKADKNGDFVVKNLNPGYKKVSARAVGFAASSNDSVHLKPESRINLDFKLVAGESISGMIVDPARGPIEGVLVSARTQRSLGGLYAPVLTDAEGNFEYPGLKPGAYTIICHKKGYNVKGTRTSARTGDRSVKIQMVRNPAIKGVVVDGESGKPLEKFIVTVARTENLIFANTRHTERVMSEDGSFEHLAGLDSGNAWLFVRARGYAATRYGPLALARGRDIEGVVVEMGRGSLVKGSVSNSSGRAVSGATVELIPQAPGTGGIQEMFLGRIKTVALKGRTDRNGRYSIKGVHEGIFKAKVSHSSYADKSTDTVIDVSGEEVTFPEISLMKGGSLEGVVRDKSGEPEAGVVVQLAPKGGFMAVGFSMRTASDGRYSFSRVPPGIYVVKLTRGNDFGGLLSGLGHKPPEVFIEDDAVSHLDLN